ncbi:SpoIIE family protein phosphatase [Microcoleus sp. FACHB-1515]|uniref:PP2C family protein-serine/threonine phosphatase n=1 Tax=Cyanophyceae TaxID=3028117 RepID=UPI001686A3AE|nr:SpoIIE family protein phosphatase [Microcoleus sp. FACHB-1515]MBD2090714.1 SpoIIE family protein phosphatase [Microcoleus sp. FACHB-1515]
MIQILTVDDDPIIQMVLKRTLEEQGYEVIAAQNGEEGLVLAQQFQPALILCDWQMDGIDGLEVCRQIKSNPALSSTFFILLTARTAIADRIIGLDAGADEFLPKPIEVNELKARVRAGLRLYRSNQELQKLAADLQLQTQRLEAEFAEAADYVRSLLPTAMAGKVSIDSRFLPSQQLGGDCFDYFWLDPDYLAFYLLDVSGHGLKSALTSVSIQNLLQSRSLPETNFYQPQAVLTALNDTFQMSDHGDQYFTIWYGVYNCLTQQLTYASAGHPPAILFHETNVQLLKTAGVPIGFFDGVQYACDRFTILPNSTLYVFSDGIYELRQQKDWRLEDFVNLIQTCHQQGSDRLEEILQRIQQLNHFEPLKDDCSLLQLRFGKS